MKKSTLAILIIASFFIGVQSAQADQRFESWQGICHFAYDEADDDNEVYFANCQNVINTHDGQDGQGRKAYGTSTVKQKYPIFDAVAYIKGVDTYLKGADADNTQYPDSKYTSAPNTPCVMVTSNYNAANDDNNETVYVTNDWNLSIEWGKYDFEDRSNTLTYKLSCRGGIAN